MAIRKLRSPMQYIQGEDALANISEYLNVYGGKAFFIVSNGGSLRYTGKLKDLCEDTIGEAHIEICSGKVTETEIQRLCGIVKDKKCSVVCGMGAGSIIDIAKAVAYYSELPIIIIPTAASSDAPCSALSIIYKENDEFEKILYLNESPNLVLSDTSIIIEADPVLLAAGMGDAYATYFEARAVRRSGKNNPAHGKPTEAAFAIAQKCREVLLRDGTEALLSARAKTLTTAFENIVEANIYLSGVGFESGGLGAAHAIQKGMTYFPPLDKYYHGQKVAFCLLVQLVLENAPVDELEETIGFYTEIGLPFTFEDFNVPDITDEVIEKIAENSVRPGMSSHNMPFEVSAQSIFAAIKGADAIGRKYR